MNTSETETLEDANFVVHRIKFFILITLQIPAIIISVLIFVYFITHRTEMSKLQNQPLMVVLIVNFVFISLDLPMPIHFYRLGYISPATPAYCVWWAFFEYSLCSISLFLMATISIQRHILIFKAHILHVRFKRYILYYVPWIFSLIYPMIFYMFSIILYPCDGTQWDFQSNSCGNANCYLIYDKSLSLLDWTMNVTLPIAVIVLANIILIVRVIRQKRRHQQHLSWRKQRRLTLQLLSISSLYLFAWFITVVTGIIQQFYSSSILTQIQSIFSNDLVYLVCLLLPWLYCGLLPECMKWIRKYFYRRIVTRNTVRPM